jgi:hypothetical protein
VSRPRRTLNRLPAQLTARQCARLLRLPQWAISEAMANGDLTTVRTPDGPAVDTRALLVELGVPAPVIDRLARRWPINPGREASPRKENS